MHVGTICSSQGFHEAAASVLASLALSPCSHDSHQLQAGASPLPPPPVPPAALSCWLPPWSSRCGSGSRALPPGLNVATCPLQGRSPPTPARSCPLLWVTQFASRSPPGEVSGGSGGITLGAHCEQASQLRSPVVTRAEKWGLTGRGGYTPGLCPRYPPFL